MQGETHHETTGCIHTGYQTFDALFGYHVNYFKEFLRLAVHIHDGPPRSSQKVPDCIKGGDRQSTHSNRESCRYHANIKSHNLFLPLFYFFASIYQRLKSSPHLRSGEGESYHHGHAH